MIGGRKDSDGRFHFKVASELDNDRVAEVNIEQLKSLLRPHYVDDVIITKLKAYEPLTQSIATPQRTQRRRIHI